MDSLLSQINEQAKDTIAESAIIDTNIDLLAEHLSLSLEQLNEAVSTWLAKVRNTAATGKLDPSKKDSVINILGALAALSNPDLADALDEKGDLGTILYNAGDKDKVKSNAALQRLLMIGREPSVKTFVANATKAIEDPQAIEVFTKQVQSKIEPIMNKKLSIERKTAAV